MTLAAGQQSEGTIPLSIVVTVDLNQLQFTTGAGRHVQQIVFLTTLLDTGNSFVTGKEAVMDLSLTDEKLSSLQKGGLKATTTMNVPAGVYQVRTIVREAIKGSLAASTIPIDLRPNHQPQRARSHERQPGRDNDSHRSPKILIFISSFVLCELCTSA